MESTKTFWQDHHHPYQKQGKESDFLGQSNKFKLTNLYRQIALCFASILSDFNLLGVVRNTLKRNIYQ